ncbi:MAG TPA: hypothetical protein VMV92_35140 [Streptosporangiaceae bacterium]|nr:hypothetical protein [Streptosporangiaceae bacterium]
MWHYLVIYDRRVGKIIRTRAYRDSAEALKARFAAEREHRGDGDVEVVVLSAKSRAALLRTHARYFQGTQELAETALNRIASKAS